VKIEPLTYIRGRSLPRRFMIIDEAQNLRPLDVKTIITRCGEGTKIVFTGDLEQIDQPYLDATSNGLSYLISRFIDQENFCYVQLAGSARSALAEQAAILL
jgi:PhoH-like ATPase